MWWIAEGRIRRRADPTDVDRRERDREERRRIRGGRERSVVRILPDESLSKLL